MSNLFCFGWGIIIGWFIGTLMIYPDVLKSFILYWWMVIQKKFKF